MAGKGFNNADLLIDELLILSYSFQYDEPRLFTKYAASNNATWYNLSLVDAVAASSATPGYFQARTHNVIDPVTN